MRSAFAFIARSVPATLALALLFVAPAAHADGAVVERPQNAAVYPIGRWPEGLAGAGGSIWVAQSGARSVARVNATTGKVSKTITVGRLPVSIAIAPDGSPIVQVNTDKQLKRINPKTLKVKRLARLPDGPERTVVDGDYAYTLLWQDDSSAGSSVLRVDLRTGKTTRSKNTGKNGFGLAVGGGQIWVARGGGEITLVDLKTLEVGSTIKIGNHSRSIGHTGSAAVVQADQGLALVQADGSISHRAPLTAGVSAVAAYDDLVVAACRDGSIWLLDPKTLTPRTRLTAPAAYVAQAIIRHNNVLWLTRHTPATPNGKGGSLLRVALP